MNQRKIHIEAMRIVAIILVVYNHTRLNGFELFKVADNNIVMFSSLFFAVLCKIAVPVFFMLSGAVLLGKEESIYDFFKKRVLRIVVVIVVFTFLQYIRLIIAGKASFSFITYLIYLYSGNIIEPYWYLKAYLGFLLAVPFLRKIAKLFNQELAYYLLILALLKMVTSIIMIFSGYASNITLEFTTDILLYPLLGFAYEQGFFSLKNRYSITAFIALILLNVFLMYRSYNISETWKAEMLTMFVMPLSFLFYSIFKNFKYSMLEKTVLQLGPCVFGIYLIEDVIRNFVEFRLSFYSFIPVSVWGSLLFSFICVLIGFLIVYIIRKIPYVSKYI